MKKLLSLCLILSSITCSKSLDAMNDQPVFAGKVKSITAAGDHYLITFQHGQARIYHYSPTVVRIRITESDPVTDQSYAVTGSPSGMFSGFDDSRDSAILSSAEMQIVIHKNPLRITILNKNGEVLTTDYPLLPVSWQGSQVTTYKKLHPDERFLGLGEKTGPLNKRGHAYQNWNSDVPAYAVNHDPLYQTIPFFIGVHDRVTYGIFFDNSFRTRFNFGASTDEEFYSFSAEAGEMNYYVFGAATMAGIIADYTLLTGRMELPPYWSLGYQQCRWSYFPESQVMHIANQFRDRKIPCDVIYLDIDYMDQYKIFTWNQQHFPQPGKMIGKLNQLGFHVATIVDPGIKIDPDYFSYREGVAGKHFITYPDGRFYTGSVWPGRCHFPDFTEEKTRQWWGDSFVNLTEPGVEGFWNDMNEPSAWGQSIPDIITFGFDGKKGTMRQAHNLYGLLMSRATYEGTRKLLNGKRTFGLTRAGYAGIQRYAAVWTGDNEATDEHMLLSARMVTGLGLSGVSFTGPDVGGFMGNPSEQLFTRWMSLGVYTPFFRNHSAWDTKAKEPWSFGLNVEQKVREMINHRYRLLPYIYSAFYQSVNSGRPVAASLALDYTFDEKVYWYLYQNQYMFGEQLLVAPVSCEQGASRVYLPEGQWYRYGNDQVYDGNQEVIVDAPLTDLPVFVRASAILPLQSVIQHTGEKPSSTLEVHIYHGTRPGSFLLYEDDGITYQYEHGEYIRRIISFLPQHNHIIFEKPEGNFTSKYDAVRLVLHGFGELMTLEINGTAKQLKLQSSTARHVEFPLGSETIDIKYW